VIGTTLAHYRVMSRLGSGGMGDIYLARDTVLGRSVALKVLSSRLAITQDRMRRFIEEAKAASALNHPNIATIHEFREAAGIHFIVMEYVEGSTLKAKITGGPLDSSELIGLAVQIAHALDAAHSIGIIHRDIKSSNIMITPRGHVKVMDFGLAKRTIRDDTSIAGSTWEATETGAVLGTVPYMSPEQALGKTLDRRSDLFSLGVVLYEMATGRLPFSGATPYETIDRIVHHDPRPVRSINPDIPSGLERLILRCLEKRADFRVQSAAELARSLQRPESDALIPARTVRYNNNLPQQLTRFIGREREMAEIRNLCTHTRLITLSGPGGIGKTRLALQIAADSLSDYDDGVWFVELASLANPDLVPQTVASTIGMREEGSRSIGDSLADYLRQRHLLLVLDNCEHVIDASAQLTDMLLRTARNLHVLATSREPLAIAGETVFRVSSLAVPDPQQLPDLESLTKHEAVELFVDRARAVKPNFALDHAVAGPLATLCVQLEGIPLAIELAASRVRVLSVPQIAARLHDHLSLLTGGSRTASPRHRTLVAAIDWSYALLSVPEKRLFRRLSVFAGGWTLEAAETVCAGGVEKDSVLDLLSGLVDKSLVLAEEREGQTRYRFMVTLQAYARKQLLQTEEGAAIGRAHADFVLALAVEGESKLVGAEQKTWLARLNAEYDNIRAALAWTSRHDIEMALRLAGVLGRFWYLRGYWGEGRRWLAELLEAPGATAHRPQRIRALNAAARIAENRGEYLSARTLATEALSLSRESGDTREAGVALNNLAIVAGKQGDFSVARSLLEESLAIRRELGDKGSIAMTLNNLGILAFRQGEVASARSLFEESLSISRDVDNRHGIATALLNLGDLTSRVGDHGTARSMLEHGLALAKDLGDESLIPVALNSLGDLVGCQGDRAAARALLTDGLKLSHELGDKRLIADLLMSLGVVAEDDVTARAFVEESLVIRRDLGERREIAMCLNYLGGITARQGDYARARSLHQEGLALCRQSGAKDGIAESLQGLADVSRLQGDHVLALSLYKGSLTVWRELSEKPELLRPLEQLALVLTNLGHHDRAIRLWGAAQAWRNVLMVPRTARDADQYNRAAGAARAALGENDFAALWEQGQAMGVDEAIAYALQDEAIETRVTR
jgi:predicted ATPase/Tfp pilus assembly protein PilF/predicted Ser/Thr protein kinase